jgi:hypothetical protein
VDGMRFDAEQRGRPETGKHKAIALQAAARSLVDLCFQRVGAKRRSRDCSFCQI